MDKRGVGRPRDGNPDETRREILRAAGEVFAGAGFSGATTRTGAARAGVNVATLHYHFGGKERLYRAVLEDVSRGGPTDLPAGTGAEAVSALVDALLAFGAERPALARLALLDTLAGPGGRLGRWADPRVPWLSERLQAIPGLKDEARSGGAEAAARAVVALVDAALAVLPGSRREEEIAGTERPQEPGPPPAVRRAVLAAALHLTGSGGPFPRPDAGEGRDQGAGRGR